MKFKIIRDQKGWTFWDVLFGVLVIAILYWAAQQYMQHPEGLNPRPVNHSPLEDSK